MMCPLTPSLAPADRTQNHTRPNVNSTSTHSSLRRYQCNFSDSFRDKDSANACPMSMATTGGSTKVAEFGPCYGDCRPPSPSPIADWKGDPMNMATRFLNPTDGQSVRSSSSPTHRRGPSSPERHLTASELPVESSLEALTTALSAWADGQEPSEPLSKSVAGADAVERAVAVRVAIAAKQVRQWYVELSAWEWPVVSKGSSSTGFELPTIEERARKRRRVDKDKHERVILSPQPFADFVWDDKEEYWGGCPARLARQCQGRIGVIKNAIDDLEMRDLESRVLGGQAVAIL